MSKSNGLLVITELFAPTKGGTAVWFDEVYRKLGGKEIHILAADVSGADQVDAVHPNAIHRIGFDRYGWLKPESLLIYLKLLFVGLGVVAVVPGGSVLLAGLLETQEATVRAAYRRAGLRLAGRMVRGDWSILWLRRRNRAIAGG